jgi:hypothetical protein
MTAKLTEVGTAMLERNLMSKKRRYCFTVNMPASEAKRHSNVMCNPFVCPHGDACADADLFTACFAKHMGILKERQVAYGDPEYRELRLPILELLSDLHRCIDLDHFLQVHQVAMATIGAVCDASSALDAWMIEMTGNLLDDVRRTAKIRVRKCKLKNCAQALRAVRKFWKQLIADILVECRRFKVGIAKLERARKVWAERKS